MPGRTSLTLWSWAWIAWCSCRLKRTATCSRAFALCRFPTIPPVRPEALDALADGAGHEVSAAGPGRQRCSRTSRACFAAEQDLLQLAFMIASVMNLDAAKEQALLETPTRLEGLRMVHVAALGMKWTCWNCATRSPTKRGTEMTKEQREYVPRQQKRAIEQELGEKNGDQAEIELCCANASPKPSFPKTFAKKPSARWAASEKARPRRSPIQR